MSVPGDGLKPASAVDAAAVDDFDEDVSLPLLPQPATSATTPISATPAAARRFHPSVNDLDPNPTELVGWDPGGRRGVDV